VTTEDQHFTSADVSAAPSPQEPFERPQRRSWSSSDASSDDSRQTKRRKAIGGLRIGGRNPLASHLPGPRQLATTKTVPQRRKHEPENRSMRPSSIDKLILGIWEQIHGSINLDPQIVVEQLSTHQTITGSQLMLGSGSSMDRLPQQQQHSALPSTIINNSNGDTSVGQPQPPTPPASWNTMNLFCRRISQASRCCRSLEVIVQARWIESYDDRVRTISATYPDLSLTKARKTALVEACEDFCWSEKDLRNKMAVWRGYHDIKEAGGWVCLVFASMGLYRFCKYRIGFEAASMQMLRKLRSRFEVAADTLHPNWRQLLGMIGESAEQVWTGHPHDWVVSEVGPPVELKSTYLQWDPDFEFEQLEDSVVDEDAWGAIDPRSTLADLTAVARSYVCDKCGEVQSADPKENCCKCFPDLYGATKRRSCPVQVYRTENGRNNGLMACCPFERGSAIGEFVGLVTRGLENMDVMQGGTEELSYQVSELGSFPQRLPLGRALICLRYGKDDKGITLALSTTPATPTASLNDLHGSGHCEFCSFRKASRLVRKSPLTIQMRTGRILTNSACAESLVAGTRTAVEM